MTRIIGPPRSRRRHWTFLSCLAVVLGISLISIAGALSVPPEGSPTPGFFELDKNAADGLATQHLGVLAGNITAGAASFGVCELGTPPSTPFTIMVDAEQMTVNTVATTTKGTGGCNFANPGDVAVDVRTWNVTRGANSSTAAAHTNNDDVTQLVTPSPIDGADWDQVYADVTAHGGPTTDNPNPCSDLAGALTCNFIPHPPGTSTFVKGTSDIADITTWHWTPQSVPDADEITDAYAAKFSSPSVANGDQFLYFGADRFASNGSKDFGFWFFKSPVSLKSDGTFVDDTGAPAKHTSGDILLLGTFTNGGSVATIRVFKWVGTGGDTNGTLNAGGSFGDCVPGGNDSGCNTVNNTTIPSGSLPGGNGQWQYLGKGEPASNVIYTGGFMEGGIDLTPLNLAGCFSSFMAETRSAPSLTAELKDLVLGRFEACGSKVVTTPVKADNSAMTADSNHNNLVEVPIGSGTVSVKDSAAVTVTGSPTFTGTVSFHICGPIAAPATCDTGGVAADPSPNTVSNSGATISSAAVTLSSVGRYCWRANFTSGTTGVPNAADSSAESGTPDTSSSKTGECFEVLPASPTLTTNAVDCTTHAAITTVSFGSTVCDKGVLSTLATQPGTGGGKGTDNVQTTYTTINATTFPPAGGKLTFTLKGTDDPAAQPPVCGTTTAAVATGTGLTTNPQDVTVSGNNTYFTSAIKPTSPGKYHWIAQYFPASGDVNNTQSSVYNNGCTDSNESLTIQQVPTEIRTNQSWFPNDTATVNSHDSSVPLVAGGTVDFFLYNSLNCSGTAKYAERITITSNDIVSGVATLRTHNYTGGGGTAPPTFTWAAYSIPTLVTDPADTAVNYSWKVVYTPDAASDGAHLGRQSACAAGSIEKFTTTYTNDNSGGTALP